MTYVPPSNSLIAVVLRRYSRISIWISYNKLPGQQVGIKKKVTETRFIVSLPPQQAMMISPKFAYRDPTVPYLVGNECEIRFLWRNVSGSLRFASTPRKKKPLFLSCRAKMATFVRQPREGKKSGKDERNSWPPSSPPLPLFPPPPFPPFLSPHFLSATLTDTAGRRG